MRKLIGLALPLLSLAGCSVTTTGDRGVVTFTPDNCGIVVCSLNDSLAEGASTDVSLGGKIDPSLLGMTTDNPGVAMVFPLPNLAWQVIATGPGTTKLVALRGGKAVDRTDVLVAIPDRYSLKVNLGPAFQETGSVTDDEIWSFSAADSVSFRIRPLDRYGDEMMGRVNLQVSIDAPLYDALAPSANLVAGELDLRPMAPGVYGLSASGPDVPELELTLVAR